jgi:tRNA(Ile)-lysidine synthase
MDMFERFKKNIIEKELLKKRDTVVLGISGGPDSICMLSLFLRLKEEWDLILIPVHLNHMLRGEDSARDALFVSEFCRQNGLECISFERDVSGMAAKWKMSLEEAGRKIRYDLFMSAAKDNNSRCIALGQNRNDQAETILMRMMRGTGLMGLAGIEHKRENLFVRPILIFKRLEIESYCAENELNPRTDLTNLEPIYTRNKIRLELLPYIEENFNNKIIDSLYRMGDMLRNDSDFIENEAAKAFDKMAEVSEDGSVSIARGDFNREYRAVKTRILRRAIKIVKGNLINITGERVLSALNAIEKTSTKKTIEFPGSIDVTIHGNLIDVSVKEVCQVMADFEYSLKIGEKLCIEETGDLIEMEVFPFSQAFKMRTDAWIVFIDAGKIESESLRVRNRRIGDRFSPLGMKGTKKLKDFLIDEKTEKGKRDSVLLLCDGNEIIWVAGYRMSELYKTDSGTKNVLKITIHQACYEK